MWIFPLVHCARKAKLFRREHFKPPFLHFILFILNFGKVEF